MTITEKVAYLKGLAEGMKIDTSANEGKLTMEIIDVLHDIALTLEEYDETFDDMAEIMSDIEESVYEIEDEIYDDEDDFPDYSDLEDDLYEISCDDCGSVVTLDYDTLKDNSFSCPSCGKKIDIDLDLLFLEDSDCGCGHDR